MELSWEAPAPGRGAGVRTNRQEVNEAVSQVQANPGEWARWPRTFDRGVPQGLRKALKEAGAELRAQTVKAATPTEHAQVALFLRWPE